MKVLTFKLSPYVQPRSINKLIHGFEIELSVGLHNYAFHSNLNSSLKYKFINIPNSSFLYKKEFSSFLFGKLYYSKLGLIGLHYNERKYYTSRPNSKYQTEANGYSQTSETTYFGNETVTKEEKAKKVHNVFENVASKYDLMNDVMSGGIHRLWKDRFVAFLNPTAGIKLLDVAGGTGDITFRVLQHIYNEQKHRKADSEGTEASSRLADFEEDIYSPQEPHQKTQTKEECKITVCDISEEMLRVGEARALSRGYSNIDWVCGDAQNLPFPDKSFDAYTIVYGMRNVVDVEKALNEAYRVLKPGGRFLCLEFSQVSNSLIQSVYDLYSFQVIPVMGQVIAADWDSYQYLVESIRKFPDQKTYKMMIEDAGFRRVSFQNLTFGVTAIHSGFKI